MIKKCSTSSLFLLGSLFSGFRHLATTLVGLLNGLDDTDGNSLSHVTDGKTTERRLLIVRFDTHGLGGNKFDDGSITRLDKLGAGFN